MLASFRQARSEGREPSIEARVEPLIGDLNGYAAKLIGSSAAPNCANRADERR
jgi:hypothetical protein